MRQRLAVAALTLAGLTAAGPALAIPAFYAVGLLTSPHKGFVVNDFWRFWVVHLWVEDFLELFTTVNVANMFV